MFALTKIPLFPLRTSHFFFLLLIQPLYSILLQFISLLFFRYGLNQFRSRFWSGHIVICVFVMRLRFFVLCVHHNMAVCRDFHSFFKCMILPLHGCYYINWMCIREEQLQKLRCGEIKKHDLDFLFTPLFFSLSPFLSLPPSLSLSLVFSLVSHQKYFDGICPVFPLSSSFSRPSRTGKNPS